MDNTIDVVLILVIVWFTVEYVTGNVLPRIRRQGAVIRQMDRGSALIIYGTVYPSLAAAFVLAAYHVAGLRGGAFYPGLALLLAGVLLRQWAVLTLGRFFSEAVGVQEGQKVVERGPYRFIRHPAYAGALLAFAGVGLALQSWAAILLLIAVPAGAYGYRIYVEEKALPAALGSDYVRYTRKTKMLIPFIL